MHILTLVLMLNLKIFKNTALFEEIWEIILLKKYKNSSRSFTVLLWTSLRVLHCPWEKKIKLDLKRKKNLEKLKKIFDFYVTPMLPMSVHKNVSPLCPRGMVQGYGPRGMVQGWLYGTYIRMLVLLYTFDILQFMMLFNNWNTK